MKIKLLGILFILWPFTLVILLSIRQRGTRETLGALAIGATFVFYHLAIISLFVGMAIIVAKRK